MLEKLSKNFVFDAHFHYFCCKELEIDQFPGNWCGNSCAHSVEELEVQKLAPQSVLQSFGLHPQNAENYNQADFDLLSQLASDRQIMAIGEAGFDYFTEDYKSHKKEQEEVWNFQLELAVKYGLPLIVHCRKANKKLFEYSRQLSKVPEVLFHSFMGSPVEGHSLLNKGINAYFSFGKQVLNGNKKVIACVKELPAERVLAETDAPFQTLKGEEFTRPEEIVKIIEEINRLKYEV